MCNTILCIIMLISVISIAFSVATMVVTCFSIRKVNVWALCSIIALILTIIVKDIVNTTILSKIQYPVLFITGILFVILLAVLCFRKK